MTKMSHKRAYSILQHKNTSNIVNFIWQMTHTLAMMSTLQSYCHKDDFSPAPQSIAKNIIRAGH